MEQATPLVNRAARRIAEHIAGHGMQPGDRLPNEQELARLLGVGRSTVREAVRVLVTRNLLEVRQGAGTFVGRGGPAAGEDPLGLSLVEDKSKLLMDLMEMRLLLEPRIAALAAAHATAGEIDELDALCGRVEALIRADRDHREADADFHTRIALCSRNLVVPTLLPIIQDAVCLFVDATNRSLREETIETHQMILGAIRAGDALAASDAMSLHIIHNRERLRQSMPGA